jgi:hypothetical protein
MQQQLATMQHGGEEAGRNLPEGAEAGRFLPQGGAAAAAGHGRTLQAAPGAPPPLLPPAPPAPAPPSPPPLSKMENAFSIFKALSKKTSQVRARALCRVRARVCACVRV